MAVDGPHLQKKSAATSEAATAKPNQLGTMAGTGHPGLELSVSTSFADANGVGRCRYRRHSVLFPRVSMDTKQSVEKHFDSDGNAKGGDVSSTLKRHPGIFGRSIACQAFHGVELEREGTFDQPVLFLVRDKPRLLEIAKVERTNSTR